LAQTKSSTALPIGSDLGSRLNKIFLRRCPKKNKN
jgi:hypothetical protein